VVVTSDGDLPAGLELDREALAFAAVRGEARHDAHAGASRRAAHRGRGRGARPTSSAPPRLRDAAAAFTRATSRFGRIGLRVPSIGTADAADAARRWPKGAVTRPLSVQRAAAKPKDTPLERIELLIDGVDRVAASAGIETGLVTARAANIARDLAERPARPPHGRRTSPTSRSRSAGGSGSTSRCSTGSSSSTSAAAACSASTRAAQRSRAW
jgi:leucyl aminopeptidase